MEKNSKNIPCPECKKTLIAAIELVGHATFKQNIKCAYCGTKISVEVGQKPYVEVSKLITIIILGIISAYQLILVSGLPQKFAYLLSAYVPVVNK